jgi:hypothetical protein
MSEAAAVPAPALTLARHEDDVLLPEGKVLTAVEIRV